MIGDPSCGFASVYPGLTWDQAQSRCSLKMPAPLCCIFILSDPLLPCLPGTSNSSTPQELVRYANFLALLHPLNQKLCGWDLAICLKKPNPLPHKVIYLRNTALEKQERSSCLFLALSGPLLCSCGTTKQLSK